MPRKFSKDSFFEGDLTPELIGFDGLSSRKISEALQEEDPQTAENYTHRNVFSGLPCSCGYWHPDKEEQTKVAAEEEEARKPRVMIVIGNGDLEDADNGAPGFNSYEAGMIKQRARKNLIEWLEGENSGYAWTVSWHNADVLIGERDQSEAGALEILENAEKRNLGIIKLSPPQIARIGQEGISEATASDLRRGIDNAAEETFGQREDFVPDLKTNAGRKIFKQNQKIFRRNGPLSEEIVGSQSQGGANAGPKVLERLDNLCAEKDAEGLLPWLAARLAKGDITPNFGYKGPLARGSQIGLNHGTQSVDLLFDRIATWFSARQSPFRQGKNVMEMNVDQAAEVADEHLEWVRSQEMIKQYSTQLLEDEMSKRKEDELQIANTPPDEAYSPMVVDLPQAIEARNEYYRATDPTLELLDPEKYQGWRAVKITTEDSARLETAILGHCIGSTAQPYVYGIKDGAVDCFSLRDPDGIPKATWHWNPDDDSLGHIQGRSGYPKDEWRELISAFNDFTGRDDDGGGEGEDAMADAASGHDYDYFYSNGMESFLESETWEEGEEGLNYWDFGTVEEVSRAVEIMEEPWDLIRHYTDDPIDDDCELDANPDVVALAADAVENYNSYPEEFIGLLSDDSYFYGMKLGDLIKGILDYWAEDYENNPREKAQYEVDENGENVVYGFDEMALKDEVDEGHIDERLLSLIQLRTPPGKDPMAGEYKERINPRETLTPRDSEGERKRDPIPEDYTAKPPEGWGTTNKDPFDNLPLTENQPVTVQQYNRELEEVPFSERMGEPMYNTFIEPRNNPADIAREYSRIWTNEGQSAANKWYYENYPNAQPVNQQLTSGWNGLMHS